MNTAVSELSADGNASRAWSLDDADASGAGTAADIDFGKLVLDFVGGVTVDEGTCADTGVVAIAECNMLLDNLISCQSRRSLVLPFPSWPNVLTPQTKRRVRSIRRGRQEPAAIGVPEVVSSSGSRIRRYKDPDDDEAN